MMRQLLFYIFTILVLSHTYTAFAANEIDALPSNSDIAAQIEILKNQTSKELSLSKPVVIEEKKADSPESQPAEGKLLVKKIIFEGNQTISSEELEAITRDFEGQTITFPELKMAAEKITALYRSRGYLISRAFLPPQKIRAGVITIQILEGKPGKIKVEDNRWFKDKIYERFFKNIGSDNAFQYGDLESSLYFLNEKEDRQARAYLEPGEEPGTTDITLKAKERFPLHLSYEFNNRGSRFTHRARQMAHLQNTNFLGLDDTLNAGFSMAEQAAFRAAWTQYTLPIRQTGTDLGLNWSYARSRLAKHLREFDIEGRYFEITPNITQSIICRRTFSFSWAAAFEIKDSKSTIANTKTSFDRMRVIKTGPRLTHQDRWGKTIFSADSHLGLGGFMGSLESDDPNASRSGAGGSFVYYSGSLARLNRLPLNSFLVLRAQGQWSPVTLTSLEQFRAGGMYSVRGYPESDSAGDRGYVASAEINFPVPFVPKDLEIPKINKRYSEAFRLVGFYDLGSTENRSRQTPGEIKNRFLMGAGFGARVNLDPYLNMQIDFGYPVGDLSTDKDRPQIHFSVKSGF